MQISFRETGTLKPRSFHVNPLDLVRITTDNTMVEATLTVQDGLKVREPGTSLVAVFNGRDAVGVSAPEPATPAPEKHVIAPTPTFLAIEALRAENGLNTRDTELDWDAILKVVQDAKNLHEHGPLAGEHVSVSRVGRNSVTKPSNTAVANSPFVRKLLPALQVAALDAPLGVDAITLTFHGERQDLVGMP